MTIGSPKETLPNCPTWMDARMHAHVSLPPHVRESAGSHLPCKLGEVAIYGEVLYAVDASVEHSCSGFYAVLNRTADAAIWSRRLSRMVRQLVCWCWEDSPGLGQGLVFSFPHSSHGGIVGGGVHSTNLQ